MHAVSRCSGSAGRRVCVVPLPYDALGQSRAPTHSSTRAERRRASPPTSRIVASATAAVSSVSARASVTSFLSSSFDAGRSVAAACGSLADQARRTLDDANPFESTDVPELTYQPTEFNRSVLSRTPLLAAAYRPTPWMRSGHAQSILATLLRWRPPIRYHREVLALSDGGTLALDWDSGRNDARSVQFITGEPHPTPDRPSTSSQPILILLPGLTGGSNSKYMCQMVERGRRLGWLTVVFNFRGIGIPMRTPRPSTGVDIQDVIDAMAHIHACFPHAPKLTAGFSMGANMLVKTLGTLESRASRECGITAAASVSCAFDFLKLVRNLHTPINSLLYSRFLAMQLKRNYISQPSVQRVSRPLRLDVAHAMRANTIREFDDRFTKHLYGIADVDHFYDVQSSKYTVRHVATPLLCLNALDDPFEGEIPRDDIAANQHIILATTRRGGHVAWSTGMNPLARESSWMMNTTLQCQNRRHTGIHTQPLARTGRQVSTLIYTNTDFRHGLHLFCSAAFRPPIRLAHFLSGRAASCMTTRPPSSRAAASLYRPIRTNFSCPIDRYTSQLVNSSVSFSRVSLPAARRCPPVRLQIGSSSSESCWLEFGRKSSQPTLFHYTVLPVDVIGSPFLFVMLFVFRPSETVEVHGAR